MCVVLKTQRVETIENLSSCVDLQTHAGNALYNHVTM